jgi:predicted HTH domain antitoxin
MSQVTTNLPDSVTAEEARRCLAMKLYELGRLSAGQAAELAGNTKRQFLELLGKHGIPIFNHSPDELVDDLKHA